MQVRGCVRTRARGGRAAEEATDQEVCLGWPGTVTAEMRRGRQGQDCAGGGQEGSSAVVAIAIAGSRLEARGSLWGLESRLQARKAQSSSCVALRPAEGRGCAS
jgi:hypothetical protein